MATKKKDSFGDGLTTFLATVGGVFLAVKVAQGIVGTCEWAHNVNVACENADTTEIELKLYKYEVDRLEQRVADLEFNQAILPQQHK